MRSLRVTVLLLVSTVPAAWAQQSDAPLSVELGTADGSLTVSYDVTASFTEEFRRRMLSGITSRARIRTLVIDARGDVLARLERRCEIQFDVWDEVAYLLIDEGSAQRQIFRRVDLALSRCGRLSNLSIVPLRVLPESGFRVLSEVALNPVSEELLEKTREFMSNPGGSGASRGSFFRTIARFFRSDNDASGESFLFRSPPQNKPEESQ